MALERSVRRLPLRDLLTDAEKRTRDLVETMQRAFLAPALDLHGLSRPVRKKSPYPTLIALRHALEKVLQGDQEIVPLIDTLSQELESIREHARREQLSRR
jgi:hypothetical protein